MSKTNSKKAFSLIELIFVIALLSIIAAVAVPKLLDSRSDAMAATIAKDISTISTSVQTYYMVNGSIDNISKAVNLNEKNWNISNTQLLFKSENNTCVDININDDKLVVNIDQNSSDLCEKIYETGVRSQTYDLL